MMTRRWELPGAMVVGAAMVVAALAGVGTNAAAAGTSSHYTLTYDHSYFSGAPHALIHWARCTRINGHRKTNVIDYKVNPAGHRYRIKLVKRGIRKLHQATGLTFRYRRKTSYLPHIATSSLTGLPAFQALQQRHPTDADLVVAWAFQGAGAHASNLLQTFEQGVGTIKWASGPTSQLRILEG